MGKYIHALPQLEAERALANVQQVAAAFGSLEEQDQKDYLNRLQIAASGGRRHAVKPTAAALAQMGITVETGGE